MGAMAPDAMAGFKADQIGGMSTTAMAGFKADQVAGMNATAMAGFKADQLGAMGSAAMGGFKADQVASLAPTAMAGLNADQLGAMAPTAMAGFSAAQMGAMATDAMAGFKADQIGGMSTTAMAGFKADQLGAMGSAAMGGFKANQVASLAPTAMAGLNADQLGAMAPTAMAGFKADQLGAMAPTAMAGFKADQVSKISKGAIGGMTADQFSSLGADALKGLDRNNLGGLGSAVLGTMTATDLGNLDATEVKGLAGNDFSKLVTNMSAFSVTPADFDALIPDGWAMDAKGDLTAPAGAGLAFAPVKRTAPASGAAAPKTKIVALPNFSSNLSLGGGSGDNSVLSGMDKALATGGYGDFNFKQRDDGILSVVTAEGAPPSASFIPDASKMVQAPTDSVPGITVDAATGGYVMITDQGYQIPLLPSIANPDEVESLLPGSDINIGSGGETSIISPPGADGVVTQITGIANPILEQSTLDAGTYRTGSGADEEYKIVYADGSAQVLKPALQDPDEFKASVADIPGATDLVIKTNGSVSLNVGGVDLVLKPLFDVTKGAEGATVVPELTNEGGRYFFTNSSGDKQEFVLGT